MKKFVKNIILHLIMLAVVIVLIIIFYPNNLILIIIFVVLSIITLKLYFRKDDIYFYVVAAVLGSIGEIFIVKYGVWQYANPTFFGIPIWLPFAWGAAVVLIRNVSLNFINKGKKK